MQVKSGMLNGKVGERPNKVDGGRSGGKARWMPERAAGWRSGVQSQPNGDPASIVLWGVDEGMGRRT